jgi:ABC-type multidrug transport system ATPase subunit
MLELKNVTLKHRGVMILQKCNLSINSRSIIVVKNEINSEVIAQALAGVYPISEGEIHLTQNILSDKAKSSRRIFYIITEDYYKFWKNYRLIEIPKIFLKQSFKMSSLYKKYHISPNSTFNSLTKFQKLIYLISIGQSLQRSIFIFDKPTQYFDYEDLDLFYNFLDEDFHNERYLIFTNRFNEIFSELCKEIYYLESSKLLPMKGGEKNVSQ